MFGDINDGKSRLARLLSSERGYKVLEELGVGSAVTYLAELRNPAVAPETGDAHGHH